MRKRLIIGIGSGRCGTDSLAAFLNAQPDCQCSHEMRPLLPWDGSQLPKLLDERISRLRSRRASFVGDIALFYLKYVPYFLKHVDDCVVLALKRDRAETVQSFNRWLRRSGWNHWSRDRQIRSEWDVCYPQYPVKSLEEGCSLYWDDYYREVASLTKRYPGRVKIWPTESLNDPVQLENILDFVGLPHAGRRLSAFCLAATRVRGRPPRYVSTPRLHGLRCNRV